MFGILNENFSNAYVNNETFTEDDVFDFEVTFEDEQTIVLKDTAGGDEITYVRQ
jgi:hypothetical protein